MSEPGRLLKPETDALREGGFEDPGLIERVDACIRPYVGRSEDLIEALHRVQEGLGCIPSKAQRQVASRLGVTLARVYGVVTFYHFFTIHPQGEHSIKACLGTACYVRGARKKVIETIQEVLGIRSGETTPDGKFSLSVVRCLGACGLAPAMMIGDTVVGRLTPTRVKRLLEATRTMQASDELEENTT